MMEKIHVHLYNERIQNDNSKALSEQEATQNQPWGNPPLQSDKEERASL